MFGANDNLGELHAARKDPAPTRKEDEEVKAASEKERKRIFSKDGRFGTMLTNPMFQGMKSKTGE